jgi:hypothetical protein
VKGSLLDVGCHDGSFLRLFPELRVRGVDTKLPYTGPHLTESSLCDFEVQTSFATISALATYEHFSSKEREGFWRLIERSLGAGGQLVMTIPHPWVDGIISLGKKLRLLDGMDDENHQAVRLSEVISQARAQGLGLKYLEHFQLGLNRLLVFERVR